MQALAEQLFQDGNRHLQAREWARAEACFREAVTIAPQFGAAHANLGWLLAAVDAPGDEAEACHRRALALAPDELRIHLNYGAFLAGRGRLHEAEAIGVRAVGLDPASAPAWSNLGALFAQMGRFDDAEGCCRMSTRLDRGFPKARINLSYLCLRQGRFEEGWEHFESRTWQCELGARLDAKRWNGEPLEGRRILLACEGGYGDMIQFSRYAAVLKRRGARRVGLLCPAALERLFATLDGVDEIVSGDETLARHDWDAWTSLMSAPFHCRTRLDSIPAPLPYLRAEAAAAARWRRTLPTEGLRVGLAWHGNPKFENDAARSLPSLETLAPLATLGGVSFVSLQIEPADAASASTRAALRLAEPGVGVTSFADTAAIIANLDLVIAVDTAVAHLAGAMGKPCWVLLAEQMPDWRWLSGRDDSPWYPGAVTLFRQRRRGDWKEVVARVGATLSSIVQRGGDQDATGASRKSQLRWASARTPSTRQRSST